MAATDRFPIWGDKGLPRPPGSRSRAPVGSQQLTSGLQWPVAAEIRGRFLDSPTVASIAPHASVRRPECCFAIVTAPFPASASSSNRRARRAKSSLQEIVRGATRITIIVDRLI